MFDLISFWAGVTVIAAPFVVLMVGLTITLAAYWCTSALGEQYTKRFWSYGPYGENDRFLVWNVCPITVLVLSAVCTFLCWFVLYVGYCDLAPTTEDFIDTVAHVAKVIGPYCTWIVAMIAFWRWSTRSAKKALDKYIKVTEVLAKLTKED